MGRSTVVLKTQLCAETKSTGEAGLEWRQLS